MFVKRPFHQTDATWISVVLKATQIAKLERQPLDNKRFVLSRIRPGPWADLLLHAWLLRESGCVCTSGASRSRESTSSGDGTVWSRSLVELPAGVLGVVQQQLTGCKLVSINLLEPPHLVHQSACPKTVHKPEGTWGEEVLQGTT